MILCFGCSFTEHTKKSFNDPDVDTDFDRWPKLIGDELGITTSNLGLSGLSNDVIAQWIRREILLHKNKIKLICVLWTEWYRFAFLSHMTYSYIMSSLDKRWLDMVYNEDNEHYMKNLPQEWIEQLEYENQYLHKIREFMNYRYKFGQVEFKDETIASKAFLEHQLITNYYSIQRFCESFNIPIIHAQGVACTPMDIKHEQWLMNTSYTDYVRKMNKNYLDLFDNNFIGWPLFPQFGGFTFAEKLYQGILHGHPDQKYELFISKTDLHPNAKGHKLFADYFIKKIKQLKIF